jgi:cell division transport system permease protein
MKLRSFRRLWSETKNSLRRNKVMSLASVGTVTVALLILGFFLLFAANVEFLVADLESQVEITAYFAEEATTQQITEGTRAIGALANIEGVIFISKEEALNLLREQFGEDSELLEAVEGMNPLRHSLQIKLVNQEEIMSTAQEIEKIAGISEVRYRSDVVERLLNLTRMIRTFGLAVSVLLVLMTAFMISNTIKLTVYARRKEIGIMKLVGATDWFIRWPFVLEGMILGLGGALITVGLIFFGYPVLVQNLSSTLPFLPLLNSNAFIQNICQIVLGSGMLIGALGSMISIRRYLQV